MSEPVPVRAGSVPQFWDRSAVFIANIESIFYDNAEEIEHLKSSIGGVNTYGCRLIPILDLLYRGGSNLLVLEHGPNPVLMEYFRQIELTLPQIEVLGHESYLALMNREGRRDAASEAALEKIRQSPAEWLDGYVADRVLGKVAAETGKKPVCNEEGSKRGNNKLLLHLFLQKQGLPTFDSLVVSKADDVPAGLKKLKAMGYRKAVIKAQIGASGLGMLKLEIDKPLPEIPAYIFFEGEALLQGWIDDSIADLHLIGSPSVQMFVNDAEVFLFDLTEQILSEQSIHEGNVTPPPYLNERKDIRTELFRQAALAGRWLHAQGYRGTASADFLLIVRRQKLEPIICEINARVTGATYPALLAKRFMPKGAWVMRNIRFHHPLDPEELLKNLRLAGLLYRPARNHGILPINFNTDEHGRVFKSQFLTMARSTQGCFASLMNVGPVLKIDWGYDRD